MAGDDTDDLRADWPLPKFHFRVECNGTEAAFQQVSGLDVEGGPLEHRAGNAQVFSTVKMPRMKKSSTVTLKKGFLVKGGAFLDWFADIELNTIERRQLTISLVDEANNPTMIWTLHNAFPVKMSSSDVKSEGTEVALESIEIAHEGVTIRNG